MKALKVILLTSMVLVFAIVAGCGSVKAPKEAITSALVKSGDVKSSSFKGSFSFNDFDLPASIGDEQNAEIAAAVADLFKGASINFHGNTEIDPMRSEVTVDIALNSQDMKFSLSFLIIASEDKIWIKIPQIPMFPLPETVVGKFIEIDMAKLMEEQGQSSNLLLDTASTQKLGQDILNVVMENMDEKTYFSQLEAKDVKDLPDGYKADQFVRFAITNDNFDAAFQTLIEKVLPQLIDVIAKNESYMKSAGLTKEQLEQAKQEIASTKESETKEALDEMRKTLKINEFSIVGGIQNGFLDYQNFNFNVDITTDEEQMTLGMRLWMLLENINKDIKFEHELPTDAIPLDDLEQVMSGGM